MAPGRKELESDPGRLVKPATDARRPVLLTRHGEGVAVVQAIADYEAAAEAGY